MKQNNYFLVVLVISVLLSFIFMSTNVYASENDDEIITLDKTKETYKIELVSSDGASRYSAVIDVVYPSNYMITFCFSQSYSSSRAFELCWTEGVKLNSAFVSNVSSDSFSCDNGNITVSLRSGFVSNNGFKSNISQFSDLLTTLKGCVINCNKPFITCNSNVIARNCLFDKIIYTYNDVTADNIVKAIKDCSYYSNANSDKFSSYVPEKVDSIYLGNNVSFEFNYNLAKADGFRPQKVVVDSLYIDYVGHNSKGLKTMQIDDITDIVYCYNDINSYYVDVDLYALCKLLAIYNSDSDAIVDGRFNFSDWMEFLKLKEPEKIDTLLFDEKSTIEAVTIYCHYEYGGSYKSKISGFTQEIKHNIYTADNLTITANDVEKKETVVNVIIPSDDKIYKPIDNNIAVYPPDVIINQGDTIITIPDNNNGGGSSGGGFSGNININYPTIDNIPSDNAIDFSYFTNAIKSVKDTTVIFASFLGEIFQGIFGTKLAVAISFALGGVVICRYLGR